MKTSARNQFLGSVTAIRRGVVNDEIRLHIDGGQEIVAVITHESTESLGLQVGSEAVALVKASWIVLVSDEEGTRFSTRNHLQGNVLSVHPGAVNTEVVLGLPGGGELAAIVTAASAQNLGVEPGRSLAAIFKASSVILGVRHAE